MTKVHAKQNMLLIGSHESIENEAFFHTHIFLSTWLYTDWSSQPAVIIIFTYIVRTRTYIPTFQNIAKQTQVLV